MALYSGIDCLLHDHADGAFPIGAILPWLYLKNGKPIPLRINLAERIRKKFVDPHSDIVEAFSHTTGLLQTEETIFEAVKNHVMIRARQGMRYDELMLAPQYHFFGELAEEAKRDPISATRKVINACIEGIKAAEEIYPAMEANLITAIGRELPSEKAILILKAIEQSDMNYAVGSNIVCDEAAYPPELHIETFEYADAAGINFEFHASEWVRLPGELPDFERDLSELIGNLRTVVDMYMGSTSQTKKRIGHGITLPYARDLIAVVRELSIGITGCPGSNLQGKNIPDLRALKIRDLLDHGILWSMNPDDDFFQPDINETYRLCDEVYRFTLEEKNKLRRNAWLTRFGKRKAIPADILSS